MMRLAAILSLHGHTHEDESGQITIFFMLIVILVLALIVLNFNTGVVVNEKLKTQNAVDASALTGGAWVARCLNHVSMNNVAMTHLLAYIMVINGLRQTAEICLPIAEAEIDACCSATATGFGAIVFGACCVAAWAAYIVLEPIQLADEALKELADPVLWKVMKALEYMNEVIVWVYPLASEVDAFVAARKNGATACVLFPYPGWDFPVEPTKFEDLCDPTWKGSRSNPDPREAKRGYTPLMDYPIDEGPLKKYIGIAKIPMWLAVITGAPWVFEGATMANFAYVCPMSGLSTNFSMPQFEYDYDKALEEAYGGNVVLSCWVYVEGDYGPLTEAQADAYVNSTPENQQIRVPDNIIDLEGDDGDYAVESPKPPTVYDNLPDDGDVVNRYAEKHFKAGVPPIGSTYERVSDEPTWVNCEKIEVGDQFYVRVRQWQFVFARLKEGESYSVDDPMGNVEESDKAKPTLLKVRGQELEDALTYLAIAYRSPRDLMMKTIFENPNPLATVTYGQVRVHNPTGVDLFTQDWHVKLVRSDLLERYLSGELDMEGDSGRAFDVLSDDGQGDHSGTFGGIFDQLRADALFQQLNQH